MPLHEEVVVELPADQERVFDFLDDPSNIAGHMAQRSWMTVGGRMAMHVDAGGGRAVGSRMRLEGRVLGMPLSVNTVVVERDRPARKAWQTVGAPRLLVIGPYRMSLDVRPAGTRTRVVIGIDYAAPEPRGIAPQGVTRAYARWCVARMAADATRAFPG